jgi:PAS domain S-box-containing protein
MSRISVQGDWVSYLRAHVAALRRVILGLAAALVVGFTILHDAFGIGPGFADPRWLRFAVAGVLVGLVMISFVLGGLDRKFRSLYQLGLGVLVSWLGALLAWNGFGASHLTVVALFPVISAVGFPVGLQSLGRFRLFHLYTTLLPLMMVFGVAEPGVDRLHFTVLYGLTMGFTYLLVEWQHADRAMLERANRALTREVERRAERESKLRESELRLERVQQIAQVGYWERNLVNETLHWSDQVYRILGLDPSADEPSFEMLMERIPEEERDEFEEMVQEIRQAESHFEFEHRILRRDGSERIVREQGRPVRNEAGEVVEVRGAMLDVTDLHRRDRQVEALYGLLRHDIRNHAGTVLGFLSLAEDKDDPDFLRHAESGARRIVELTDSDHALVESLEEGLEKNEPVRIEKVLREEVEAVRHAYPEAEIEFENKASNPSVRANRLVGSVFRNLFLNAIQHSDHEDTQIRTTVSAGNGNVLVRVADDGPGIPDEVRDRLFRRGAKGRRSSGTGLGLYLVQTLVDQYGGEVCVEENEPRGTVFTVKLPQPAE